MKDISYKKEAKKIYKKFSNVLVEIDTDVNTGDVSEFYMGDFSFGDGSHDPPKKCALIYIRGLIEQASKWKSSYMGREEYEKLVNIKKEIEKL